MRNQYNLVIELKELTRNISIGLIQQDKKLSVIYKKNVEVGPNPNNKVLMPTFIKNSF